MTLKLDGSNGVLLTSWNTAGRPASPLDGMLGFNSTTGFPEYYTNGSWRSVTKFDYTSTSNPTISTNPSVPNATWLNTSTGALYICTNNTAGVNVWSALNQDSKISPSTTFDIFGDSSAVAFYQFESAALGADTGGAYNMSTVGGSAGSGKFTGGWAGGGSYMKNGNSMNNNLVVSVSAWVNVTDTGNNWIWSSGKTQNGANKRGVRIANLSIDVGSFSSEYNGWSPLSGGSISSGVWTHVCVSKNKVYVNGTLTATMATYTDPSSDTYGFYIGANGAYDYGYVTNETYGMPMNGNIDQLRIFNRELTQSEVTKLYQEA